MDLRAYIDQVATALSSRNGLQLARLLSVSRVHVQVNLSNQSIEQITNLCNAKLARFEGFSEVISGLVQARKWLELEQYNDACGAQIASVMYVMPFPRNSMSIYLY